MVVRQTRMIALLLVATIIVAGLAAIWWFGPQARFVVAHDRAGNVRFALSSERAAVLYIVYAAGFSLVLDRASRIRRWRRNIVRAGGAFAIGWLGALTLVLASQAMAWAQALGRPIDRDTGFAVAVALIVLLKANLLPKSRPAWFNGTALPLFAPDPVVWRRVHHASALRLTAVAVSILVLAATHPPALDLRSTVLWLLIGEISLATVHARYLSGASCRRAAQS